MATINCLNTDKPIEVAKGGTGDASLTAYAVICGGTTSTTPLQSIASVGTAGQVLTSNGAALPTFEDSDGANVFYEAGAADPGSPVDGDAWFNTTTPAFKGRANSSTVTFTVT